MGALRGVRILECGELVAAPYAAKLLGHLGADVVKVEPPIGDRARWRPPFLRGDVHPERSGLHLYLNQAKRSVIVDSFNSLLVLSNTIRLKINVAWTGTDNVTRSKEILTLFTVEGDK